MGRRFAAILGRRPLTAGAARVALTESIGKTPGLKDAAPVRRFPFFQAE